MSAYASGKPLPPRSQWVPRAIALPADDDLNEHARLNPDTQRIEDAIGNVLWPEGSKQ